MFPVFQVFGLQIYSYPLLMGMAWGIAYQISQYLKFKQQIEFPRFNLFFWGTFISSWVGAKVFFLLTTTIDKSLLLENSNFWLGGGFVFYGGLIFGGLYCLTLIKLLNIQIYKTNIFLPSLALAHGVGRVGCFLAGCCFGKEAQFFWSIHMHDASRHPVQLFETIGLIFIGVWLWRKVNNNTSILFHYILSYSALRFTLEFLRGDKIRGVYFNTISTSQIIALLLISISICVILVKKVKSDSKLAGI